MKRTHRDFCASRFLELEVQLKVGDVLQGQAQFGTFIPTGFEA
jgi:hypothetical protein